ncbi:hypothetical protein DFJ73DRAFT_389016 [Zopfochytrium polystomum]|nr:hypothetical protein DFJ73DRAFT_389016 [Zopfochytrium polystomum]
MTFIAAELLLSCTMSVATMLSVLRGRPLNLGRGDSVLVVSTFLENCRVGRSRSLLRWLWSRFLLVPLQHPQPQLANLYIHRGCCNLLDYNHPTCLRACRLPSDIPNLAADQRASCRLCPAPHRLHTNHTSRNLPQNPSQKSSWSQPSHSSPPPPTASCPPSPSASLTPSPSPSPPSSTAAA